MFDSVSAEPTYTREHFRTRSNRNGKATENRTNVNMHTTTRHKQRIVCHSSPDVPVYVSAITRGRYLAEVSIRLFKLVAELVDGAHLCCIGRMQLIVGLLLQHIRVWRAFNASCKLAVLHTAVWDGVCRRQRLVVFRCEVRAEPFNAPRIASANENEGEMRKWSREQVQLGIGGM